MCGICGFNWDDKFLIKKMSNLLSHRGPDDQGQFTDNLVSLGHRRLSIIDLNKRGRNPLFNVNGDICIVFNGEIYNYKSLRLELEQKGHSFSTDTDTEVIINAYKEYGTDCLKKFNGMFAFCIYDLNKKKLFLARDRIGIKPLYIYNIAGQFAFASEIKSLLELGMKREINKFALNTFFTYRFTQNQTLFSNISKVEPGTFIEYDLKKKFLKTKKYWDVSSFSTSKKSLSLIQKELYSLMNTSVKQRLVADVPVTVFLSGGLDSSIIASLASKHTANLKTFSVGFSTTNELSHAKRVAEHVGSDHKEINIKDDIVNEINNIVYHMDEPIGDAGFVPIYALSKQVKKEASVALGGDGADELFSGYDRYKMLHYGSKIAPFIPKTRLIKQDIFQRLILLKGNKSIIEKHNEIVRLFDKKELKQLNIKEELIKLKIKGSSTLDQAQYFDLKTVLPNDFCMKFDKMTSAHGVEGRVPFLDHNIVEYAFKLPSSLRLKGFNEKFILKKTFKSILPKETIRRKKHGFDVPMNAWFRGELKTQLFDLVDQSNHKLYNKEPVIKLLKNFQHKNGNYKTDFYAAQKLWSVLMFELWHKKFIN